jgi:hypothetical protein
MRRALQIAPLVVATAAVIVRPALLPYVALGAVPGFILLGLSEVRRRRTLSADARLQMQRGPHPQTDVSYSASYQSAGSPLLVAAVVGVALVSVVLFLGFTGLPRSGSPAPAPVERRPRPPEPVVPLAASYEARLEVTAGHSGSIEERLEIPDSALARLRRRERLSARFLPNALARHGWRASVFAAAATLQVARTRPARWRFASVLPRKTTNQFAAPLVSVTAHHRRIELFFAATSKVVVSGPRNAFGNAYPAAQRTLIPGAGEELTMPLPTRGQPARFELSSNAFRHWPLTVVQDITAWNPIGLILGALPTLLIKRVRKALAELARRLRGRRRRSRRKPKVRRS